MVRSILRLGNPELYESSDEITETELPRVAAWAADLHDTLMDYRGRYGAGRAVAAPQIGVKKRLIYLHIDSPQVLINPRLEFPSPDRYIVLDDCMSFPGLRVRVWRYREAVLHYRDEGYRPRQLRLTGDLSELLQHECDHLDGVLATMRAVDDRSLVLE